MHGEERRHEYALGGGREGREERERAGSGRGAGGAGPGSRVTHWPVKSSIRTKYSVSWYESDISSAVSSPMSSGACAAAAPSPVTEAPPMATSARGGAPPAASASSGLAACGEECETETAGSAAVVVRG